MAWLHQKQMHHCNFLLHLTKYLIVRLRQQTVAVWHRKCLWCMQNILLRHCLLGMDLWCHVSYWNKYALKFIMDNCVSSSLQVIQVSAGPAKWCRSYQTLLFCNHRREQKSMVQTESCHFITSIQILLRAGENFWNLNMRISIVWGLMMQQAHFSILVFSIWSICWGIDRGKTNNRSRPKTKRWNPLWNICEQKHSHTDWKWVNHSAQWTEPRQQWS